MNIGSSRHADQTIQEEVPKPHKRKGKTQVRKCGKQIEGDLPINEPKTTFDNINLTENIMVLSQLTLNLILQNYDEDDRLNDPHQMASEVNEDDLNLRIIGSSPPYSPPDVPSPTPEKI